MEMVVFTKQTQLKIFIHIKMKNKILKKGIKEEMWQYKQTKIVSLIAYKTGIGINMETVLWRVIMLVIKETFKAHLNFFRKTQILLWEIIKEILLIGINLILATTLLTENNNFRQMKVHLGLI